ncbi:hypothetical protein CTA2_3381 [Colletotrichum tanaceti]|nr:hypothetical protein CTA2_3381 [Colletotrichum tanaceti]
MLVIKKNQEAKEKARQRAQSTVSNGKPSASPQQPKQEGVVKPDAPSGSRPGTAAGGSAGS